MYEWVYTFVLDSFSLLLNYLFIFLSCGVSLSIHFNNTCFFPGSPNSKNRSHSSHFSKELPFNHSVNHYGQVITIYINSLCSIVTFSGIQLSLQSSRVRRWQWTFWPLLSTVWKRLFFPQFGIGRCHQKNYYHRLMFQDMTLFHFYKMRFWRCFINGGSGVEAKLDWIWERN